MGKLGVELTDGDTRAGVVNAGGAGQATGLMEVALAAAGGRLIDGAIVVVFDSLDVPDVVVLAGGSRFYVGPSVEEDDAGDAIVAKMDRPAPAGASLSGPPFKANQPVFPDGECDLEVEGPWGAVQTQSAPGAEWMPWDALRRRFEGRVFDDETSCRRRCWFLNVIAGETGFEHGMRPAGTGPSEQERIVGGGNVTAGPRAARGGAGATRVELRQAIWEASQHATTGELRELFEAVVREIESDSP